MSNIHIIKKRKAGFSNGGWNLDRYRDLEPLSAGAGIVIADLPGPGVIKHIHTTRHAPFDLFARGISLEVYYDGADVPAIDCPLADFFGDGCNGRSPDFSSLFIECAPVSYNCYFTMPFKLRCRVVLRNRTDRDATNYSYVEWEPLRKWKKRMGYFHAAAAHKTFQLTPQTKEVFFYAQGEGHLIGRQFSITTGEPFFKEFNILMEGNNEVDIDGTERALDYLGTEDSFTFSWGFQRPFAGLRAGMPLVDTGSPHCLSLYRFHDRMPIRFQKEIRWAINWQEERHCIHSPEWAEAVARGGCQVDYRTVFYYYQRSR